jgi:tetratricopeptide (TPR) repeat protein
MAGFRFKPLESSALVLSPAQDLQVAYQIWAPSKASQAQDGQEVTIQYALGEPALTGSATVLKDTVNMSEFTTSGSLVNGKKISLSDKPDGTYILTVSASGPDVSQRAHSTLSFQILSDVPTGLPWDVDEPGIDTDEAHGTFDLERALCFLAQDNSTEARRWFRVALSKNHSDDVARAHLVEAYYNLSAYSAIVSLFNDAGITEHTDSSTIAQIAESMLKTGDTSKALSILQDAIRARPDDGPLYLALADSYQQMGKQQQAEEMTRKGKSLLGTAASQPR